MLEFDNRYSYYNLFDSKKKRESKMDKLERLKEIILEKSFEYREDASFKLSSGAKSQFYFDCKKTTLDPEGSALIGELLLSIVKEKFPDIVGAGGLTLGADPMGAALMHHAWFHGKKIFHFIVRKELKKHGSIKWIEGNVKPGDPVLILDDVVTTGGSVIKAIERCKEDGLRIEGVTVLIDREEFDGLKKIKTAIHGKPVVAMITRSEIMSLYSTLPKNNIKLAYA